MVKELEIGGGAGARYVDDASGFASECSRASVVDIDVDADFFSSSPFVSCVCPCVVVFSIATTIILQGMAARLGLITQKGLAEAIRSQINHPIF